MDHTGRLTVLDYLINELGADPVAREKSGISSVHAAVQAGRYKAVKVSLQLIYLYCNAYHDSTGKSTMSV